MYNTQWSRSFILCAAVATLFCGGCGAPGAGADFGSAPADAGAQRGVHRGSWMRPASSNLDLLYVADYSTNIVYVFSYPQGSQVGELTGFDGPWGECTDAAGDVWITNYVSQSLVEYQHGGTVPVETLSDRGAYPVACSVDPTTGNLAIANVSQGGDTPGNVVVYQNGSENPTSYTSPDLFYYDSIGYDAVGDIFVDGTTKSGGFEMDELPVGGQALESVSIDASLPYPVGIQSLGGENLAIGGAGAKPHTVGTILDAQVDNEQGEILGQANISDGYNLHAFFVEGSTLVASEDPYVELFRYPKGRKPVLTIKGFETPIGVAVSVAH